MKNLINILENNIDLHKKLRKANADDVIDKDLNRFMKDYKKFREVIKDVDKDKAFQRALDKIDEWITDLDRRGGLPYAYPRYEQFTWVMASFDDEANNDRGGLYDKEVIDKIIKYWKKATGYTIYDMYKDHR